MTKPFEIIVIGLGGMGSAATYHLSRRGKRVLGLEQYTSPHNKGSSHGKSRIIRQAYFEDPAYVPLVMGAYELWKRLEKETGKQLLNITGGLMIGRPDSQVVSGSMRSANEYGLPHEILDAGEIQKRFPPLRPESNFIALYEKMAGFLHPEETVKAHLDRAVSLGAVLRFEEPVLKWEAVPSNDRIQVSTSRGIYEAERLIITPGPWAPALLAELNLPLKVERLIMFWFDPIGGIEQFLPDRFPLHIWEIGDGTIFYGLPAQEGPKGGVKVALHTSRSICAPETIDREVRKEEIALMRRYLASYIPALDNNCLNAVTCMYTSTPDEHFVVGIHPKYSKVVIAAGFSGHGYKFASVVGEILADLAMEGITKQPIALFSPTRFSQE